MNSTRRTASAVGTVFRCVASRREAPGYRHLNGGTLFGVGGYGLSWSTSRTENHAYYLSFGYGGLNPQEDNCRASGFPLRCLQEEGGGRAADFTLEPGGLSVRENLLRLACGAVELWGLNESLTSSPLEPRGLLLSVMRQKVGKERNQGDSHPLG